MGPDRYFAWQKSSGPNVRLGSEADIGLAVVDVRFTPESGHCLTTGESPLSVKICSVRQAEPLISDVNLFGNCKRVIHFNAKVAGRALDLRVTKKKLNGS